MAKIDLNQAESMWNNFKAILKIRGGAFVPPMSWLVKEYIFQNIRGIFSDDIIYSDDSNLWSNKEIKIKA